MKKIKTLNDVPAIAAYLQRIGAEPRSLRTAVVQERKGKYWDEVARVRFVHNGAEFQINSPDQYLPTENELADIQLAVREYEWPQAKTVLDLTNAPQELRDADQKDVFIFRNENNEITLVQLRAERKGERSYIPFTFWDDGEWRKTEPESKLPLWGLEHIKEHTTVFIHEGAKAARAMHEMVNTLSPEMEKKLREHPWGLELSGAAHVGWIGGALSPRRTDWSMLMKMGIKRAYIVSDNDEPGKSAVPAISFQLRVPTFHVQFTTEWPASFDLADPFPEHMFKEMEGSKYYIGPSFRSCVHPATWATDQVPNQRGKPTNVLRKNFSGMWAYVEQSDVFVCIEMPEIIRSEPVMNKMLAAFSHTNQTSHLMVKQFKGRSAKFCYRPDIPGRIITNGNTTAVNLHTPTLIRPAMGNPAPWLEFLEYMFPIPEERNEVAAWIATLVAKPQTKMDYGLLLVSEMQGVGKTTLGSAVVAPLVGLHNTGFPSEASIVQSQFNGWLAHKRLVIVNEIYSGHSWKAYNKLKSAITDREIEVNEKYQRPYTLENWAHMMAFSNSLRALKVESNDRRWYYPEVTEERWSAEKFRELYSWLQGGGLSIIYQWALEQEAYIPPGRPAPLTEAKRALIEESRSEAASEAMTLASIIANDDAPIAMCQKHIMAWLRQSCSGQVYDTDLDIRKAMKELGLYWSKERLMIQSGQQHVCVNEAALKAIGGERDLEVNSKKRSFKLQTKVDCNGTVPQEQAKQLAKSLALDLTQYIKSPGEVLGITM